MTTVHDFRQDANSHADNYRSRCKARRKADRAAVKHDNQLQLFSSEGAARAPEGLRASPDIPKPIDQNSDHTISRYNAKLIPATQQFEDPKGWRAGHRLNLRQIQADDYELADRLADLLGDKDGRKLAARLKACGIEPIGDRVTMYSIGGHGYVDTETCAKVHICPVCSAKIRGRVCDRCSQWVDQYRKAGGFHSYVTLTQPHQRDNTLRELLDGILAGWAACTDGDWYEYRMSQGWTNWRRYPENYREIKARYDWDDLRTLLGIDGYLSAEEITWGAWHGWHVHRHKLFFHQHKWDAEEIAVFEAYVRRNWTRGIKAAGRGDVDQDALDFQYNIDAAEVAKYITKVQDNWTVVQEITRGDIKTGRKKNATYFELMALYYATGDLDIRALCDEYIKETKGMPVLRSSPGLKDKIPDAEEEKTDEELAAEDVGGNEVGWIGIPTWRKIVAKGIMHGFFLAIGLGLPTVNDFLAEYECGRAHAPEERARDG